jgi:hypothetical protein
LDQAKLSKPLAATTLALRVLLALKVWLARVKLVAPATKATSVQVLPLLSEMRTFCPAAAAWLKVPLMVCAAVWVMKSPPLLPL